MNDENNNMLPVRRDTMKRTLAFLACLVLAVLPVNLSGQREEPVASLQVLAERVRSIRELLDERKEQVAIALQSAKDATLKAEEAQQRVNATQNEFRGSLKDQAAQLATKEVVEALTTRILALERARSEDAGRTGGLTAARDTVGAINQNIFGFLGMFIAVAALFIAVRRNKIAQEKKGAD